MPSKSFKVNIFNVETSDNGTLFADAIDAARSRPLAGREKLIRGSRRRLDTYLRRPEGYLLNFVAFRFAGPSRVRSGDPVAAMGLGPDEFYGDDTAMLYDPDSHIAFVESTIGGMGPGAIGDYFAEFADPGTNYVLIPRLDAEATARARGFQTIRKVVMRVAMGPVTDVDRESGVGLIKGLGENFDAGTIDIEIKAQREKRRSLLPAGVWRTINAVLGDGNRNNVTQLVVVGREDDDDRQEVIDLLQHRERRERLLPIDDAERKVYYRTRWDALIAVRQEFLE